MWRRMEYIGTEYHTWAAIYSDYSHHAPAIAGNIEAITKQFPDKKILIIFQPHQAQRVLVGRDDFAHCTTVISEIRLSTNFTLLEKIFENFKSSIIDFRIFHHLTSLEDNLPITSIDNT
jgi:UDP-N-acetylmuramate--alanine ligase